MASSKKTTYYNLSQFQDTDKPSWRGDYNADMDKIDTGLQSVKTSAVDAKTAAQNAESSINEVKQDYLKKTDAQNTYATKTALSDTKTTIENNADSKFVSKTVYDTAIASKADKTNVYTKTESDGRFQSKAKRRKIVVIGDSYMTGYQPNGSPLTQSARIPYIMASKLDADVHVHAANAAGYAKAGDGGNTFSILADDAKTSIGSAAPDVTDVVIAGGINDTGSDIQTAAQQVISKVLAAFTEARVWVFYLYYNNSVTNNDSIALSSLRQAASADYGSRSVHWVAHAPFYGMTFTNYFANSGSDIHPNADGARHYGTLMANVLDGAPDDVTAFGDVKPTASGMTGNIQWRMSNGVLSLTAKFNCSAGIKNGTQLAQLPKCFNLGDGFILALINAGNNIAFFHLQDGKLVYTGTSGVSGNMTGNCWIAPTAWTPIKTL